MLLGIEISGVERLDTYTRTVTTRGDHEVTFHLKQPQASFLAMLATGWTPIYPCHVSPAQMRLHPMGTAQFKFVGFKPNQSIAVARNPDYWKPGRRHCQLSRPWYAHSVGGAAARVGRSF